MGGSGRGGLEDLRPTTAPMVEISLSNMAWTVLVWTRVRCGDSLACMHVRMYCTQDGGEGEIILAVCIFKLSHTQQAFPSVILRLHYEWRKEIN